MTSPSRFGWRAFVCRLQRLEARADAWAGTKLTAQEFADAKAFDRDLKRNFWRWLAIYLLAGLMLTLLVGAISPKLKWGEAFVVANVVAAGLVMLAFAAWFRHSKFIGKRGRRSLVLLVLGMFAGGMTGVLVGSFGTGKPLSELTPDKIARIAGMLGLIAAVVVAILSSVAWFRNRDIRQRLLVAEAQAERERHARSGAQAELKLLQAQVEPHFLFNTLANVRYLVDADPAQAVTMLDHLIHYLRTALPEIRAESSTVGREIELAHAYLEILRIRMGGALHIATELAPGIADLSFPPLVLLTLVENAVKHGIAPQGSGEIRLSATRSEAHLRISVEDDGRGLVQPIGQGIGLANVRERLQAIYGDEATLSLESRSERGTIAAVEVPVTKEVR